MFDTIVALVALIVLFPIFVLISLIIKTTSHGEVFYKGTRAGKNNIDFIHIRLANTFGFPQKENSLSSRFSNWKTLVFVLAIVIVIIFNINIFQSNSVKPIKREAIVKKPVLKKDEFTKITEKYAAIDTTSKPEQTTPQMDTVPVVSMLDIIKKPVNPKPTIPEHTIIRIERLSSSFKQGKVYVTVDQSSSIESMRLLCTKIKKDYKEFSNIIICLYADSPSGNELASGTKSKLGTKEQSKAWLAMYSYNTVEGEYFDDNPGGYLGAY